MNTKHLFLTCLLAATILPAQTADAPVYTLAASETEEISAAWQGISDAYDKWQDTKARIKEAHHIAPDAGDLDFSPSFRYFRVIDPDITPMKVNFKPRQSKIVAPTDVGRWNSFASACNSYTDQLIRGIRDLKAWARVTKAWSHLLQEDK